MSQRLGDLLVKEKIITPEQLQQAIKVQKEQNCRLGSALVKLSFLTDEDVTNFLSRQYGVPAINLSYFEIDSSVVKLIPYETAKRYQILPLSRVGASLTIAMVDPTNVFAMDDIKFMTGFNIEPVVASESAILEGIEKAYGTSKEEDLDQVMQSISDMDETDVELQADAEEVGLADLEKAADEAPIVKLVNLILTDAVKRGASDIHIEPYEKEFRVRFRIDGMLQSHHVAATQIEGRHYFAHEDHGEVGHQRKAAAARRPHHAEDEYRRKEKAARLPRQHPAHSMGRKNRDAVARQGKPAAGYDQARLRVRIAGQIRKSDLKAIWNGAGNRAYGFRKN